MSRTKAEKRFSYLRYRFIRIFFSVVFWTPCTPVYLSRCCHCYCSCAI